MPDQEFERELEGLRPALTAHCYQMLGSLSEAEDAVQTSMIKAWRNIDSFRQDASLKTWVYRITTHVCLDMLKGAARRMRPMEEVTMLGHQESALEVMPSHHWLEPYPTPYHDVMGSDPEQVMVSREHLRLAVVAALQHLPAKQRAALLLTEVLGLSAEEAAQCLECSVSSLNSALQRARSTIESRDMRPTQQISPEDDQFARRFVTAFEAYDLTQLATMMHEDVVLSMPPFSLWLRGVEELVGWFGGRGIECKGSRLVKTCANGELAFGQYRPNADGGHRAWALLVLEREGSLIRSYNAFLDVGLLFPRFDLPMEL